MSGGGDASAPGAGAPGEDTEAIDFERSLRELEALVERLEAGELTLEESLRAYERGVRLTRACQKALDDAERRIEVLAADDETPRPLDADDAG